MAVWLPLAFGLAACSAGSGADPFAHSEQTGRGSNTLEVVLLVRSEPASGERAAATMDMVTRFEVRVMDSAGAAVRGANVVVDSRLGAVILTEEGCETDYCGVQQGYAASYELEVAHGGDFVRDVLAHGPTFHRVTAPEEGDMVAGDEPLEVRWSPSGEVTRAEVRTRSQAHDVSADPGVFEVPAGLLRAHEDRLRDERVRVARERRVRLSGALGNSMASIRVRNGVEFFTEPTPED